MSFKSFQGDTGRGYKCLETTVVIDSLLSLEMFRMDSVEGELMEGRKQQHVFWVYLGRTKDTVSLGSASSKSNNTFFSHQRSTCRTSRFVGSFSTSLMLIEGPYLKLSTPPTLKRPRRSRMKAACRGDAW
ncbi:hypothetical protein ABKN59_011620 [Abortiporus biennis]